MSPSPFRSTDLLHVVALCGFLALLLVVEAKAHAFAERNCPDEIGAPFLYASLPTGSLSPILVASLSCLLSAPYVCKFAPSDFSEVSK